MTTSRVNKHVCPLCEGMCGIRVSVEGDRVVDVRPDVDNVFSRGHVCPKGVMMGALHHDPDRLRVPMIREGSEWREASWEQAFAHIATLRAASKAAHPEAIGAAYFGNMTGKGFALPRYLGLFLQMAGLVVYSSATVDQHPKNLACQLLFGDAWKIPIPDLDNTDLFLIMGANPAASNGSILCHPDVMGGIRALRARGGKAIVVDPARTGTADKADQWIPIRPGTDAALLLALAHVVFAEGAVRLRQFEGHVDGIEAFAAVAARFSPERVAPFCGIPAETIRALARMVIDTDRAAIYGRIGLCTQEFGTLASWMIDVLALLTGNLDRVGGSMWTQEIASHFTLAPFGPPDAPIFSGYSRVRGAPNVMGQFPASCMAEEIVAEGPGQIRTLVTLGANPVLSAPGSAQLAAALPHLDCMVCIDNYINETTRHAHVILPSPSLLEQPHWDIYGWTFSLTRGGHYSPAVFEPQDRPEEWRVLTRLGAIMAGTPEADVDALDETFFATTCERLGIDPVVAMAASPQHGPERILDLLIRTGPEGDRYGARPQGVSLQTFKDTPDGLLFGHAEPQGATALRTASGKIDLAHPYILADVTRLEAAMQRPTPETVLISRRQLRTINSWTHNVPALVRGRDRCTLQIHPTDARRIGVDNGDMVRISNSEGEVHAPAEVTDAMQPGIVSLPHGWGHGQDGTRINVANRHPGANINVLSPGTLVDAASGNAVLNGIPVEVSRSERSAAHATGTERNTHIVTTPTTPPARIVSSS